MARVKKLSKRKGKCLKHGLAAKYRLSCSRLLADDRVGSRMAGAAMPTWPSVRCIAYCSATEAARYQHRFRPDHPTGT